MMKQLEWRLGMYLLASTGLAAVGAGAFAGCTDDTGESYDGQALCEEISEVLRGCELLSEGEPNCRLFADERYGECASACIRAATCDELRAQACDDVDNEAALCIDRCQAQWAIFECGDGNGVARELRCDGARDCANGADESDCAAPFDCGDGAQVAADLRCDGDDDCANAADEAGCPMRAMTLCPGGF